MGSKLVGPVAIIFPLFSVTGGRTEAGEKIEDRCGSVKSKFNSKNGGIFQNES